MELAEIGSEIEARERLERITDGMASAGTLEKEDRKSHLRGLQRAGQGIAEDPAPVVEPEPVAPEDAAAQLAAWGIGIGPE